MESYSIGLKVSKIKKEHFSVDKNGEKWLNLVMRPSKESKYGESHYVAQNVPKEAYEAGARGEILGNAKPLTRKPAGAAEDFG